MNASDKKYRTSFTLQGSDRALLSRLQGKLQELEGKDITKSEVVALSLNYLKDKLENEGKATEQ